jgi:hypothetical protein
LMLPIVKGVGPTPIPRPERYYFQFQPAIETHTFHNDFSNLDVCKQVRDQTHHAVSSGLQELLELRELDPHRPLRERVKRWFSERGKAVPVFFDLF